MSRIEWTRLAGEDVEHVVAVLLCSENPAAQMIRPGQGDGGLDVIVPVGTDQHDVYQVKRFASNLANSQKRQIARSFKRLQETVADGDINVRNWFATMPLDPTPGNLSWFAGLTAEADFTSAWRGLTFVESLAAHYPNVIDYYLRDGADRLRDNLRDLTILTRGTSGDGVMTPTELWPLLDAARRTVDTDPHFRYGISLDPIQPTIRPEDPAIFTTVRHDPDLGGWVTIRVYERFAEALNCRPVTLNVKFHAEPGSDLADDLADWRKHGKPFTAPDGTVDIKADLPGGLGDDWTTGMLKVGPTETTERHLRLILADASRRHLAVTPITLTTITNGHDGQGYWSSGTEDAGVFTLEATGHLGDRTMSISMHQNELTGLDPATIGPALDFIAAFPDAHYFGIALQYGPTKDTLLQHLDRSSLKTGDIDPTEFGLIGRLAQALALIQAHTSTPLRMPDLREFTKRQARDLIQVGRLLDGGTVTNTSTTVLCGTDIAEVPSEPFQVSGVQTLAVVYDDNKIPLGDVYVFGSHITATAADRHDDHADYELSPLPGTSWTFFLDPANLPVDPVALADIAESAQPQPSMLATDAPGEEGAP